ncbi:hypothetical protein OJ253_2259 [Cryptosporidium canis]|uniref:Uncharacterized protein n=1 Tax=Cryptosporidium canis TaxID=195482 RepID=A0A9D5DKX6_9CRYT|nr:hypothetical protein OJ253_2259 [Cryptosporidium canis]
MELNNKVSLSLLTFLRYEYLNYCIEKSSELITDEKNFQLDTDSKKLSISGMQVYKDSLIRELSMSTLEESGFYLGIRLVERLSVFRHRIYDQKEIIKFICKDLWSFIFLKQADRLKTNRRGGYAILDNELMWLSKLPSSINVNSRKVQFEPAINVITVCGIIRGALQHLGLTCSVAAEVSKIPSCLYEKLCALMHISGTRSNSITPMRRPFETFVTGSDGIYKSVERWRSKCYSSNDDYLSPSFLDDTCSLSSSPIFYDETPKTVFGTPTSPCNMNGGSKKIRVSIGSMRANSNENTPTNNSNFRRSVSLSTPMLTPRSAKNAVHDEEGFLIPDLPGTSKRRHYRNNYRNDLLDSYNKRQSVDPVHITMPPRLGLPSQTPLNMKDQHRKSPLPVVSANLDYRTAYMGDRLAMRAKDLRKNYGAYLYETPLYRSREYYDNSCSDESKIICEDDLVLHHGEILRNRYSKLYETRVPPNDISDVRSRSLSSYYSGDIVGTYSPVSRSNSVAMNHHSSIIGHFRSNNKRRRLGSYISSQNDILQQNIQLIDQSLERCSNNGSANLEDESFDYLPDNEHYTQGSRNRSRRKSNRLSKVESDIGDCESVKASNKNNKSMSRTESSYVLCNPEDINQLECSINESDYPLDNGKNISEISESNKSHVSPQHIDHTPIDLTPCSPENGYDMHGTHDQAIVIETDLADKFQASPGSDASLDEIVPHPIQSESCSQGIDELAFENENSAKNNFTETNDFENESTKTKKYGTKDRKKHGRGKNINRRRHIDYHIPIDQVKPQSGLAEKQLMDSPNIDDSSRRYPKRLRTAPLKWYLGERLEYQRDEKNELGYTIAAIHKVANPKMLPNERGSIHPNNEVVSKKNLNIKIAERRISGKNTAFSKSKSRPENANTSKRTRSKKNAAQTEYTESKSNAVVLKDYDTNEEFSMISVFDRNELCWADVEYTTGKPYNVALSFISSQATCCEIRLPPMTEKGLDESQDNYILGHVYKAPDNNSLQIMISDNNIYNIGVGDWFLIPDNTNYNFSNTSGHSEIYISLYVIKDS